MIKITGTINNPEIVCAPLNVFARDDIITIIVILNKVKDGTNKKIVNNHITSVKIKIFPSKCLYMIRFTSRPRNTKKTKLKRTEGINATNTFAIIISLLEIGNTANDSIVLRCFSPANESALKTALIIDGVNKK